jgi:hypothetical protein
MMPVSLTPIPTKLNNEKVNSIHMAYEKPKLVDLSSQSGKGFGDTGCATGSGETFNCVTGPTAEQGCDQGNTFTGGGSKYED